MSPAPETSAVAHGARGAKAMRGYDGFRAFLEGACGIHLGDEKAYLVESRLRGLMTELDVPTLEHLVARADSGRDPGLRQRIVDAMTTNETLWFRDAHPFDTLREAVLPELAATRPRIRLWSAGCSTGQEPYSIAILVEEMRRVSARRLLPEVEIVATDLSPSALAVAREGRYPEHVLRRGMDDSRRRQHFEPDGDGWRVREPIRRRVAFSQLNLLDSYAMLGRFDVVFCRNVLIYFNAERKRDILDRIGRTLSPGGFLVLGGTESMTSTGLGFERLRGVRGPVYRKL